MELDDAKRGDRLSAEHIRELSRQVMRNRPTPGSGAITTSGGTGYIRDDTNWFLVKITEVTGSGKDAKYSFTEQHVIGPQGGVDGTSTPGELEDWSVARKADKDINPARSCVVNHTFVVDEIAMARRNIGAPEEFELWPAGGSDWEPYRITGRTDGTPPIYTGELMKLVKDTDPLTVGDQLGWVAVTPAVTFAQGVRMPSKDYDEDVLIDIPVGQVVLARPSPTDPGVYEITPWGGLKKSTIEHIYRVCVQCILNGSSQPILRTKMAIRKLSEYGRDRRVLWQPPATGESGIDDNTDNHIPGS